jgi:hypothetical protein
MTDTSSPEEQTMRELGPPQEWRNRIDDTDPDAQLKQFLALESENNQLKKLVVRLSETIIRNVTSRR